MKFPPSRRSVAKAAKRLNSESPEIAKKAAEELDSLLYPNFAGLWYYEQMLAKEEEFNAQLRGTAILKPLVDLLFDGSTDARICALENLSCIGDARCCDRLLAAFQDISPAIRSSAASACGWWPKLNVDAPLIALLDDSESDVVCAATSALGKRHSVDALPKLLPEILLLAERHPCSRHVALARRRRRLQLRYMDGDVDRLHARCPSAKSGVKALSSR